MKPIEVILIIAVVVIFGIFVYQEYYLAYKDRKKKTNKVFGEDKTKEDVVVETVNEAVPEENNAEEKDTYSMHDIWVYIKEHKKENDIIGVDAAATHPAYPGNVFTRIWIERVGEHCGRFAVWELTDSTNQRKFHFMDCDTETVSRRMLFNGIDNIYKEMVNFFEETEG